MENYFLLFTDSLMSSLILPVYQGFVFRTMLYFRLYYNPLLILFFGIFGSSLGGVINWYLGKMTIFVRKLFHKMSNEYKTPKIVTNLLICAVVLFFSWVPVFGSVIQILSGYFRSNFRVFALLTILSNFFHLLYLIITIC
ncbi:MAG: DedA family protein [Wolbachia endosymbiont of Menacanthus eurysternus]|nr:MAG: DedA family protein [Wolbachia endosymbiont of Menacanthus eurysternus]